MGSLQLKGKVMRVVPAMTVITQLESKISSTSDTDIKRERKLIIHAVTNNTVKLEVIVTILLDHISPEIPESFLLILLLHFLDMQGLMKKVICQGTDVIKVIIENHTKKL